MSRSRMRVRSGSFRSQSCRWSRVCNRQKHGAASIKDQRESLETVTNCKFRLSVEDIHAANGQNLGAFDIMDCDPSATAVHQMLC